MTSGLDVVSLEANLEKPAQGTMLHHLQELVQHAESKGWEASQ